MRSTRLAGSLWAALWILSLAFLAIWLVSAVLPVRPSEEAEAYFREVFLLKARRRATLAYVSSGLNTLAMFGALYLVARLAARRPILSWAARGELTLLKCAGSGFLLGLGAAALFSAVSLPFGIYRLYLERGFGLSRMTLPAYLLDYGKSTMLSAAMYSLAGGFAAMAFARFPRTWHFLLGGAFLLASLVVGAIYPTLIAPLFDKFHPLPPGPVLSDVRELADKAGMQVDRVLVMEASAKTTRMNAYFAGIGGSKQVVLYDTLLARDSREQVRLVVAHELGHWKLGHVVRAILISAAGVFAALWLFRAAFWAAGAGVGGIAGVAAADAMDVAAVAGAGQAYGLPYVDLERFLASLLVFAALAGYVLTPASSYVSRTFEVQSDAYSLQLTGDRAAFVSTQVSLAMANLGDIDPPPFIRWFAWTHPTTLERIRAASQP